MRRIVGLAVVVLASTVLLAGCGGDDDDSSSANDKIMEKMIEGSSDEEVEVDLDSDDGGVKIETEDGTTVIGGSGDLPDNFPDDLPLPSGDYTVASTTSQGDTFYVVMSTEPGVVAEGDAMVAALASAGFTMEEEPTKVSGGGSDTMMVSATRDGLTVMITLSSTEGETNGTAMYIGEKSDS